MLMRFSLLESGLVIFGMVCLCSNSLAQRNALPNIPCPNIFLYARSGNKNIGIITIGNIKEEETTVAVELSQREAVTSNYYGKLSLNFNKTDVFRYIAEGEPFTYRVDFPLENVVPRVTLIEVNGVPICSGPKYGSPSTTLNLQYTLRVLPSSSASSRQSDNDIRRQPLWTNFNRDSDFTSDISSFNPSSFPQPSGSQTIYNSPSASRNFARPSFNSQFHSKQSFNRPAVYQPSFSHHLTSDLSTNQAPLNTPAFDPQTYKFPPFNQVSINPSLLREPTYNQPSLQFKANPQNPFFKTSNGSSTWSDGTTILPPGSVSLSPAIPTTTYPATSWPKFTNLPQRFASPLPAISTTTDPAVFWTIFTPSTTTDTPATTPTFEIDDRNPETASKAAPEDDINLIFENPSTNRGTFEYIDSVCGQENYNFEVQKLNINGTAIKKSRFPWIVALYKKLEGEFTFRCGGSLISTRTVVSAAHCFYEGLLAIEPDEFMVSMGRHNLSDWRGSYNFDVERIITHPDFDPRIIKLDGDIAVVRLKLSVTFTTSVRPICMWKGPTDPREIEGVSGAIVGWGSDTLHKTTIVPTIVNATIVSELSCVRSDDQFFFLTSNRTLCAGNLDGTGPCYGDSGNGLMIRNKNKWMLRGTVSATVGNAIRPCLLDKYAIYSDVAMFMEWIRLNMLL